MRDYNELIRNLRDESNCNVLDYVDEAATAIESLVTELSEERYRHDRLQDFEVAQAQELARVKEERDAAFSGNTTPQPVPQEDPEWKQRVLRTFLGGSRSE